jgi:hypothetical protein
MAGMTEGSQRERRIVAQLPQKSLEDVVQLGIL